MQHLTETEIRQRITQLKAWLKEQAGLPTAAGEDDLAADFADEIKALQAELGRRGLALETQLRAERKAHSQGSSAQH